MLELLRETVAKNETRMLEETNIEERIRLLYLVLKQGRAVDALAAKEREVENLRAKRTA